MVDDVIDQVVMVSSDIANEEAWPGLWVSQVWYRSNNSENSESPIFVPKKRPKNELKIAEIALRTLPLNPKTTDITSVKTKV